MTKTTKCHSHNSEECKKCFTELKFKSFIKFMDDTIIAHIGLDEEGIKIYNKKRKLCFLCENNPCDDLSSGACSFCDSNINIDMLC